MRLQVCRPSSSGLVARLAFALLFVLCASLPARAGMVKHARLNLYGFDDASIPGEGIEHLLNNLSTTVVLELYEGAHGAPDAAGPAPKGTPWGHSTNIPPRFAGDWKSSWGRPKERLVRHDMQDEFKAFMVKYQNKLNLDQKEGFLVESIRKALHNHHAVVLGWCYSSSFIDYLVQKYKL